MANRNRRSAPFAPTSRSPTLPPNPFIGGLVPSPVPEARTRESFPTSSIQFAPSPVPEAHNGEGTPISPLRSYSTLWSPSYLSPPPLSPSPYDRYAYLTRPPPRQEVASPRSPIVSPTANFITLHTSPTAPHSDTDECPICLDAYTTEPCLRITGIAGCNHHIGATCLQKMLENRPHAEKKCPLCRTVWIPAPVFQLRGQSPDASRRMADMFHGLDGIGADIAGTQGQATQIPDLHEQTIAGNAERAGMSPSVEIQRATTRPRHRAERTQQPIVIDSDSEAELEEDFATQVRNFENLTRDIEDIRQRARNTIRSSKRQSKRLSGGREGHDSGSGSDHSHNNNNNNNNNSSNSARDARSAAVTGAGIRRGSNPGGRPRASTFNRLINTMRLAPWEQAMSETRVRRGAPGSLEAQHRSTGQALPRNSAAATPVRETAPWEVSPSPGHSLPPPSPPLPPLAIPTVAETIAALESNRARIPNRTATIGDWLMTQGQTLRTQEAELARREAQVLERERRAEQVMEIVRRHGREIEALFETEAGVGCGDAGRFVGGGCGCGR